MAELPEMFGAGSKMECLICRMEVGSIRILPCAHQLCDDCLAKLAEERNQFPCPHCRRVCMDPQAAIRKHFGEIKCPVCQKMKDVDEYFWCVQCQNLMCCRCLAKDHGFRHELLDWNTKEAYTACFRALSNSAVIPIDQLTKAIDRVLKPIMTMTAESIQKNAFAQKDVGRFLAQTYGISIETIGNGNEAGSGKNAPTLMKVLGQLAGVTLPIDPKPIGRPIQIRNLERVCDVLVEELEFSPDHHSSIQETGTQTLSGTRLNPLQLEDQPVGPLAKWESQIRRNNSYTQTLANGYVQFGPFDKAGDSHLILGPVDSCVVIARKRAVFFISSGFECPRRTDWTVQCIEAKNNDFGIVTAAIDSSDGLHLVSIHENRLSYLFWSPESEQYVVKIFPTDDIRGQIIDATICCTNTGIPFLFVVLKKAGSGEIVSALYKFGNYGPGAQRYEFARIVCTIPDSHINSASVVREVKQKLWILGADGAGIQMFRRHFAGTMKIEHVRYIPWKSARLCSYGTLKQQAVIIEPSDDYDYVLRCYDIQDDQLTEVDEYGSHESCIAGFQEDRMVEFRFEGGFFKQTYIG